MKVFYKKQKPKIIQYRSYKNFDNQVFQRELNSELFNFDLNNAELSEFTEIFLSILDNQAPKNRANNSNFVTNNFRKAIMKRSKLRNKYLRERKQENKSLYEQITLIT